MSTSTTIFSRLYRYRDLPDLEFIAGTTVNSGSGLVICGIIYRGTILYQKKSHDGSAIQEFRMEPPNADSDIEDILVLLYAATSDPDVNVIYEVYSFLYDLETYLGTPSSRNLYELEMNFRCMFL